MSDTKKVIELNNISFSYDKYSEIFYNLSLDLYNGEITAITGKNGSGKTTLGKLIMGMLYPVAGEINIFNNESSKLTLSQKGQLIGYLFQNPERQLFAATVYEELSFILELKGYANSEIEKKVKEMLAVFQIEHLKDEYPFKLSGGEKQRLALATVIINNPQYLILDEPTTALDIKSKEVLSDLVNMLKNQNRGIMIISHDEYFVKQHAQRIIEIEEGKIIFDSKFNS